MKSLGTMVFDVWNFSPKYRFFFSFCLYIFLTPHSLNPGHHISVMSCRCILLPPCDHWNPSTFRILNIALVVVNLVGFLFEVIVRFTFSYMLKVFFFFFNLDSCLNFSYIFKYFVLVILAIIWRRGFVIYFLIKFLFESC